MIHVFDYHDKHYIYDTGSGSLHECDEKTARYLSGDRTEITDEEIAGILADVGALKEQGLLYKEEVSVFPAKSSEVKALCLHICHDCNLRCRYCFADEGAYHSAREMMSRETAKAAIDFLLKNSGKRKVLEVDFFGGEPLMNLGVIKETVYYAKEEAAKLGKKFLFTTTTNALLLDDETIEFLNAEMENVVLSIDGRKEVHDAVRKTVNGKGSFDLIVDKFRFFRSIRGDKSYFIRGTFTSANPDFANDVLEMTKLGFDQVSVEPVVLPSDHPLAIKPEQMSEILDNYEKLAVRYVEMRKKPETWFSFFHFVVELENGPCYKKRLVGCGAGSEYVAVTPDGSIYPCHQFAGESKYLLGNVFEGKLNEEVRDMYRNSSIFTKPVCQNCWAKYHCSGGCAANAIHYNGDINKPYAEACEMMKKRLECALYVYAKERKTID